MIFNLLHEVHFLHTWAVIYQIGYSYSTLVTDIVLTLISRTHLRRIETGNSQGHFQSLSL